MERPNRAHRGSFTSLLERADFKQDLVALEDRLKKVLEDAEEAPAPMPTFEPPTITTDSEESQPVPLPQIGPENTPDIDSAFSRSASEMHSQELFQAQIDIFCGRYGIDKPLFTNIESTLGRIKELARSLPA